jgi:hypothetical protein
VNALLLQSAERTRDIHHDLKHQKDLGHILA